VSGSGPAYGDPMAKGRAGELAPPQLPEVRGAADAPALDDEWDALDVGGDLTGATRARLDVRGCVVRVRASGLDAERARLNDTRFAACELSGVLLGEAQLQRVELVECRLSGADFGRAHLRDVRFTGCRLDDANLRMLDADRVVFDSCVLSRADFGAARLAHASFLDCDLTDVDFSNAQTSGVALHGSQLDGMRNARALSAARIDRDQVLPFGLRVLLEMGVVIGDRDETAAG
jgi:Pentapeptide repeats (9 copies)